jgi:hypothetical protein
VPVLFTQVEIVMVTVSLGFIVPTVTVTDRAEVFVVAVRVVVALMRSSTVEMSRNAHAGCRGCPRVSHLHGKGQGFADSADRG